MKKFYFLIVSILVTSSVFSQAYKPMLKENKTWEDFETTMNLIPMSQYPYFHSITFLDGDTTINGINYYKMFSHDTTYIGIQYWNTPALYPLRHTNLVLVREDTLVKKVWVRSFSGDTTEHLFYDFSLNAGDTMILDNINFGTYKSRIDSIKPYLLNNNETTRAFYLTPIDFGNLALNYCIIEGVGSITSFIFPFITEFENNAELRCVKDNGINLFSGPFGGSNTCGGTFVNLKEINKIKYSLDIYPNPSNGKNILISGEKLSYIEIYNIHGQLVKSIKILNSEVVLNLANQPNGIYFIKALFKNGKVISKKLILTRQ
jgi:hypothetical protein